MLTKLALSVPISPDHDQALELFPTQGFDFTETCRARAVANDSPVEGTTWSPVEESCPMFRHASLTGIDGEPGATVSLHCVLFQAALSHGAGFDQDPGIDYAETVRVAEHEINWEKHPGCSMLAYNELMAALRAARDKR